MGFGVKVLVSGPRACFTRPEMKAERVSYDVMTPSAARGLLESVYWKPAIRWVIDSITVLNEIRFDTFRRNELGGKLSYQTAKSAMQTGVLISKSATDDRQQRATLFLKDVRYIVRAHFVMTETVGEGDTPEKHYNIALRRLRKGQCFQQPYLGCREFSAEVQLLDEDDEGTESYYKGREVDLGFMLYDIDFENGLSPMFFRAQMKDGCILTNSSEAGVLR